MSSWRAKDIRRRKKIFSVFIWNSLWQSFIRKEGFVFLSCISAPHSAMSSSFKYLPICCWWFDMMYFFWKPTELSRWRAVAELVYKVCLHNMQFSSKNLDDSDWNYLRTKSQSSSSFVFSREPIQMIISIFLFLNSVAFFIILWDSRVQP